jgi:hypothetical protein
MQLSSSGWMQSQSARRPMEEAGVASRTTGPMKVRSMLAKMQQPEDS